MTSSPHFFLSPATLLLDTLPRPRTTITRIALIYTK